MGCLALTLFDQRSAEEAETMLKEQHDTQTRVLGLEHPETFQSMHNLGLVMHALG